LLYLYTITLFSTVQNGTPSKGLRQVQTKPSSANCKHRSFSIGDGLHPISIYSKMFWRQLSSMTRIKILNMNNEPDIFIELIILIFSHLAEINFRL